MTRTTLWRSPNVYVRAVPAKEAKAVGLDVYRSRILGLATRLVTSAGRQQISPSACCTMTIDGRVRTVLVPADVDRVLADAIVAFAEGLTRGERRLRFIRVYHAYELLANRKDPVFKAIRHALAHAPGTLTHARTLETLAQVFGATDINLKSEAHRRVHDVHLARMVLDVDGLVTARIDARLGEWIVRSSRLWVSMLGPTYSLQRRSGFLRSWTT